MKLTLALPLLLLASCAIPRAGEDEELDERALRFEEEGWLRGDPLLQGWFGAQLGQSMAREGGGSPPVEEDGDTQYPVIGGGAQWKLGGERVDWGLEGMISFGWRANGGALATGAGGAQLAVDVDLLVVDLFGGPFASAFLGEDWRVYGAAGPLMQYVEYDQEPVGAAGEELRLDGNGFGLGYTARAGVEYRLGPLFWLGLGARWSESTVDLGGGLGDLELEGVSVLLTVTRQ